MTASAVRFAYTSAGLLGRYGFRTVQRYTVGCCLPYQCNYLSHLTPRRWCGASLIPTSVSALEVNRFIIRAGTSRHSQERSVSSQPSGDPAKEGFAGANKKEENAEREEAEKRKKAEFSKQATKYALICMGVIISGTAGYLLAIWGAPPKDERGDSLKDQFSDFPIWKAYLLRTWNELIYYNQMIKEPSREKLLPDPLQEPYFQPPFTLVLEMTEILVHPDWTYKTGWRFKKRPGVDFLLHQAGPPLFEIVIYTSEQGFTAFPIIDSLDADSCIMYRLFRDATRYVHGHHVKDLSCLNRDLSRVIFVDWNEKSFQLQPENSLKLKKWSGNDDDTTLFDLAMFLRTIATSEVEDVRTVLGYYKQFDDPLQVFKENQKRLQEEQDRLQKQRMEKSEKPAALAGSWASGFFGRRH